MNETPLTDALQEDWEEWYKYSHSHRDDAPSDPWDHARELERELSQMTQERDALHVEYESRAIWIREMNQILGYDNTDGYHSEPAPHEIATDLVAERDTLRDKLHAAEADKERMEAIEAQKMLVMEDDGFGKKKWVVETDADTFYGDTAREAIDAAMKEGGER